MNSKIWGPSFWFIIHSVAINFPDNPSEDEKRKHEIFFTSLQYVLPCEKCREHYKKNLRQHDLRKALESKKGIFDWSVRMHNEVNVSNGGKEWQPETVSAMYYRIYRYPWLFYHQYFTKMIWVLYLIILLLLVFLVYRLKG
jgi:hypothetical protein